MATQKQLEAFERQRITKLAREHKLINGIDHKICNKHHIYYPEESPWLPSTTEYFYHNNKNKSDFLYPYCKQCGIQSSLIWIEENPERRQINQETYLNGHAFKLHRDINRIQMSEWLKQWRKDNPEKLKGYNADKNQHKHHTIKKKELQMLYEYCEGKCMYCGMTEEYHKYLYNQRLHKDHGYNNGSNGIENCILACKSCNTSKHKEDWDKWYTPDNIVYSEDNYNKIVAWLDGFKNP